MKNEKQSQNTSIKKYSLWVLISFQFGSLVSNMVGYTFIAQMQYYYETVVLIDIGLYTLAFLIYTVWNMINDPLIGYLCDRSTRWTKKWGKRFPFIIFFGITWSISFALVFMTPSTATIGQLGVFFWLLIAIILYDTLGSGWGVNYLGLFPDKFRDDKQRKKSGAIMATLATIGLMIGAIMPAIVVPLFGDEMGYGIMAVIMSIIGIIFMLGTIPGIREDVEMRERRSLLDEKKRTSFSKGLKQALKHKNFIIYIIYSLLYALFFSVAVASIPFWVGDMLGLPKTWEMLMMAGIILAQPLTAPIWYKIALKIGSKFGLIIGNTMMGLGLIPLLFVPNGPSGALLTVISMVLVGIGGGGRIMVVYPIWSDVIDEATVNNEKREEGLYQGINTFITRLSIAGQVVIFFLVRILSGYTAGSSSQSTEALFGLRVQTVIIPLIIMLLASFIFWKWYDLTPDKVKELKVELEKKKL